MSFQQAFKRCLISVVTCDSVFDALTDMIFDLLFIIFYKNYIINILRVTSNISRTTKKILIAKDNFYNIGNFKLKI